MKKKPMLMKKVLDYKPLFSREIVGLIGTHRGAGVTHTGLMLAIYMGEELQKRTALLEVNDHYDMEVIEQSYEWDNFEDESFSYQNITCYKKVTLDQVPDLLNEPFDCFILDFGTDFSTCRKEFLRCTKKLVIGSQAEWNQWKLLRFHDSVKGIKGSDTWIYLIPYATDKTIKNLTHEFNRRIYTLPFEINPINYSNETVRLFYELLHN
ncbi:MAG: hypothetical protein K0S47_1661 [Herbinix sp.]|jgi:hypothetical protein|nr:hypothetical protein [Herbinix sp.]